MKQFIYASSGSVYGVKDEPKVTEDLTLVSYIVYNKTKMVAERVFLSIQTNAGTLYPTGNSVAFHRECD